MLAPAPQKVLVPGQRYRPRCTAAPVAPVIKVVRGTGSITVSWTDTSGLKLQSAPSVSGPWTDVGGVVGTSATVSSTAGNLFLRLGR